jgi:ornithine decarboxylase
MSPTPRRRSTDQLNVAWPASLAPAELDRVPAATPFLATDRAVIGDRYHRLRSLVDGLDIFYAVKCNSSLEVLEALVALGSGFEIASYYELDRVVAAGARPADVLYSNPVKPIDHIAGAFGRGVDRFAADSEDEIRKLATVAPGARVYLRLQVDDHRSLFPLSKKFGTSVEEACRLLLLARDLGLVPHGLTFHVGSQCTDPAAWRGATARCGVAMRELDRHGIRIEMLDLGGGLPARYTEEVPAVEETAGGIVRSLAQLPYRPSMVCAEPGRYLVAESSVMATTVIGMADRGGERWAYLDVGGYTGLMETIQTGGRWHFPVLTDRADHHLVPHVPFTLTGPSCDSSDTMFRDLHLPLTLATGDRLYIGTTGAYTLSYASHFNGFASPTPLYVGTLALAGAR